MHSTRVARRTGHQIAIGHDVPLDPAASGIRRRVEQDWVNRVAMRILAERGGRP
jgi:hypothetical protein